MLWVMLLVVLMLVAVPIGSAAWKRGQHKRASADRARPPVQQAKRNAVASRTVPYTRGAGARDGSPRSKASGRPAGPGKRAGFEMRWFGEGETLKVHGFKLRSPGVYASSGTSNGTGRQGWATDPSEILLDAPVRNPATRRGFSGTDGDDEVGYWPWYSRIDPFHRHAYLSWLASERSLLPPLDGLLFLYFYGIERRLLVDGADRSWALREVVRLRRLDAPRVGTREGRSFRGYSAGLLWFELARTPEQFDPAGFERVVSLTERWMPELLTAPLAWLASTGSRLPTSLARAIAEADPASQRSVVTKRVPEEFTELFEGRYLDTFGGEGLELRISKRDTWHTYRPASGGLQEVRVRVPNPMGIRSQFKKLPEVWNSCIADLRKLSRVSLSMGSGDLTVAAWEAMPAELRADVDHPLADEVTSLLAGHAVDEDGSDVESGAEPPASATRVLAGQLAALVGIERRPRLTAAQSRRIADTLEKTGYGLVPDARITPIRYRWDEPLAVVPGLDDDGVESSRYNAAACVLRLGLSIAQADGQADSAELRVLTDHIDAVFDLPPEEQRRLAALRDLLLETGSDIRPIARKIQSMLPADARGKVGRLLVVIAAATNGIDRAERAALRKAYRALGLEADDLEQAIAEIAPEVGGGEIAVSPARANPRAGEPIQHPAGAHEFRLNHATISTIMSETREVSLLLAEAMGAADAEAAGIEQDDEPHRDDLSEVQPVSADARNDAADGPEGRYAPLYAALIARERWPRDQADAIARSLGLMLNAGVEEINDWAFEALGSPMIEDTGDELQVDRGLLQR